MISTQITDILFPNRCEVIEIKDQGINVYLIYKNGSSSLYAYAARNFCKIIINEQINKLNVIDIILRNPQDRFVSGVNTYVYNTKRDNPQLDLDTIIYFAENYLFLNRHYLPQIGWLINLSKYTDKKTIFRLKSMSELSTITPDIVKPIEEFILSDQDVNRLRLNSNNEMYLRIDSLLLELIGQELCLDEILGYIKEKDPVAFQKVLT